MEFIGIFHSSFELSCDGYFNCYFLLRLGKNTYVIGLIALHRGHGELRRSPCLTYVQYIPMIKINIKSINKH